ncbi:MAG: ATP phosphoribosyltransferase regulatory subunit [Firmicutes bacterium HGW-Firmicutes-14]|jgi:ATP phosphoribosyltransferase regulatory subunit|nr:MAG: ATP phosphoribosyltransferase regulatory subunit [Firmicutes bacterium HGW-Firmicutes-14]
MTRDQLRLKIPAGVRDLLPGEALRKRSLENDFEKIFRVWGYQEVITPTFEYYDVLSVGRGAEEDAQLYKFIDRQGQILTLRPDMTTPIARLISSRMRDDRFPCRIFYMANGFSCEDPQAGRQREFYQSGIELVGDGSPFADAEVIAVAVEILKTSGLRNFKVSIGHVDILYGMIEKMGLPEAQKGRIKAEVSNKNYVGLQELLDEFNVPVEGKEKFMQVITTRGDRGIIEEALRLAGNDKTGAALKALSDVYDALEAYGITANVEIDLGVLRGLDYYTGVVFEGYSAYLGFPILGGGRYDNLMEQFGFKCPATGFALGMERLLLSLEKEGGEIGAVPEPDYLILYEPSKAAQAFKKARELRDKGKIVITQLSREDRDTEILGRAGNIVIF